MWRTARLALSVVVVLTGAVSAQTKPTKPKPILSPFVLRTCETFEPPTLTRQSVFARAQFAVLRLESGAEQGTGFIVDGERGLVVSAAHVVRLSLKDSTVPIHAFRTDQASSPVELQVVKSLLPDVDAVLLQYRTPPVRRMPFLEIALRPSARGAALYSSGYSDGEKVIRQQEIDGSEPTPEQKIRVFQAIFPGDSGSPLIDERGYVVAMAVSRKDAGVNTIGGTTFQATYLPTYQWLPLFNDVPVAGHVSGWHQQLAAGTISREELAFALTPESGLLTNLDILSWILMLGGPPPLTDAAQKLARCPVMAAAVDRRLGDAVLSVPKNGANSGLLDPELEASAFEGIAERAGWLGDAKGEEASRIRVMQLRKEQIDAVIKGHEFKSEDLRRLMNDDARAYRKGRTTGPTEASATKPPE